ncbi:MAG: DUF4428 domain-containing protein [Lachnospiraceae bacterium]|nr:DUF4428 domain-containing protein [Lachnospiraceae bacterium]
MGLFDKLFKKENCTICGNECGSLGRTKLRDGEYVCSNCVKSCSSYVRVSEFTRDDLIGHMDYMKVQDKIYNDSFMNAKRNETPSAGREQSIVFCDEIGMFEIRDRKNAGRKNYHELFRYDQVESYEPYVKYGTPKEGSKEKPFEEYGITITFLGSRDAERRDPDMLQERRAHPYVKQPVTVVLSRDEKEFEKYNYANSIASHFDVIFGVHDDQRGLFSFSQSKQQKRETQAQVDMAKMFGTAFKAAKAGEDSAEMEAAKQQFSAAKESTEAAKTRGLSKYSEAADAAEALARKG